jgi:hypothetical protein
MQKRLYLIFVFQILFQLPPHIYIKTKIRVSVCNLSSSGQSTDTVFKLFGKDYNFNRVYNTNFRRLGDQLWSAAFSDALGFRFRFFFCSDDLTGKPEDFSDVGLPSFKKSPSSICSAPGCRVILACACW